MWDWSVFFHTLVSTYLIVGALKTLGLTVGAMIIGLAFGIAAALMRVSGRPWLSGPAAGYIWVFRGTPVLVQLVIIYTGLPAVGVKLDVVTASLVGLGVNEGAYIAEIIRGGIISVSRGQMEAARSIGMTFMRSMRLVVLPQAFRAVVPPLGNTFNGLLKLSALASVISMDELLRRAEILQQTDFRVLEIFAVAAIYYLIYTTSWGFIQQRIERYLNRGEGSARVSRKRAVADGVEWVHDAH